MAVSIEINSVDKSDAIDWRSVNKSEALSREPDTLTFMIKNYGTKTYKPELSDTVELFDGATKIFGGQIIEIHESIDGLVKYNTITCKDYTILLDKQLVSKTYENMTGNAIIADLISTFTDATDGITGTNVACTDTVEKIVFNYVSVTQALSKLTGTLGNFEWYIDYDKDIHFFEAGTILSPFSLTDTSQNYIWGSLDLNTNNHQIRNHIILRGGDVLGDEVINEKIVDGAERIIFVGYNFDTTTLVIEKSLAATPTVWVTQTVGIDGKDSPTSKNCLYNANMGHIIFPEATKPAINDHIRVTGTPIFPLITEQIDYGSVGTYGEFEYVIVDKTIQSREAAAQRINAELLKFGRREITGSFRTTTSGLRSGQVITLAISGRDLSADFLIDRISTKLHDNSGTFEYTVSLKAQENIGIMDVLNKLLVTNVSDQIAIGEGEVVDRLYSSTETITFTEVVVTSVSSNPQTETVTLGEVTYEQPLNYSLTYVYGNYEPTIAVNGADHKRTLCFDGGYFA